MDHPAETAGGGITARQALLKAESALQHSAADNISHDVRALLAHLMEVSPLHLLAQDPLVPPKKLAAFNEGVTRLAGGEPLQYILGEAWFMGFPFAVNPHVLIPRQDTETVCQAALDILKPGHRVLDLCTGSGALAVAIKKLRPDCRIEGADISPEALAMAKHNAASNGVDVLFFQGDFFAPVQGPYDLIVCNPPYIPTGDMEKLQPQVKKEPALALHGGAEGLDFYRRLLYEVPRHLSPQGYVVCELGDNQAQAVRALAEENFDMIEIFDDLGHLPRALRGRLKEGKA